jgi:hypothetical protein
VYHAVAGTDGLRVTAAVHRDAVGILPADHLHADEAVRQARCRTLPWSVPGDHAPGAVPADLVAVEHPHQGAGDLLHALNRPGASH